MALNRTIFAPATLVGDSSITVIRIGGDNAITVISKIFSLKSERFFPLKIETLKPYSAHHGYIFDGEQVVDEVIITVFKAPNSFTGEDIVEISSHGGSFIYRKINSLFSKFDICHAEPGEFSKRAFLNGKIDLAQAESIADLIKAKTERANSLALNQLVGEFSNKITFLKDELINYCSLLELELDFSEEGIDLVSRETLLHKVNNLIIKFQNLTKTYDSGKIIQNGVNLAIVGRPNVGKSTIFNYLLKENRAIVSEIPGTTRDYLKEPLIIEGIQFNLIDTAGIHYTDDIVEQEGISRTMKKIEESDIVLEVNAINGIQSIDDSADVIKHSKVLKVYNKADLSNSNDNKIFSISAKTGYKMDILQQEIVKAAKSLIKIDDASEIIITNQRHRDCLLKCCEFLVKAREQIMSGGGNELISYDIRMAMDAVAEILGKVNNVDILNNVFSKFCIGK